MKKTIWFWLAVASTLIGIFTAGRDLWNGKFYGMNVVGDIIVIAWNAFLVVATYYDSKLRAAGKSNSIGECR